MDYVYGCARRACVRVCVVFGMLNCWVCVCSNLVYASQWVILSLLTSSFWRCLLVEGVFSFDFFAFSNWGGSCFLLYGSFFSISFPVFFSQLLSCGVSLTWICIIIIIIVIIIFFWPPWWFFGFCWVCFLALVEKDVLLKPSSLILNDIKCTGK